jgi:predicted RNase H-like HicB family nuclease
LAASFFEEKRSQLKPNFFCLSLESTTNSSPLRSRDRLKVFMLVCYRYNSKIQTMIVRAIIEWDEEAKAFSATCPELNFISSCGDTKEEAIDNLKEAINLLLEPIPDEFIQDKQQREIIELSI